MNKFRSNEIIFKKCSVLANVQNVSKRKLKNVSTCHRDLERFGNTNLYWIKLETENTH